MTQKHIPRIETISDLDPLFDISSRGEGSSTRQFFAKYKQNEEYTVINYTTPDTRVFRHHTELAKEARGIWFCNFTGKTLVRPMGKMFNFDEIDIGFDIEEVTSTGYQVYEKLDGSLINITRVFRYETHEKLVLITGKRSLIAVSEDTGDILFDTHPDKPDKVIIEFLEKYFHLDFMKTLEYGYTYGMEYVSPNLLGPVLENNEEALYFLVKRDVVSGEYMSLEPYRTRIGFEGVRFPKLIPVDIHILTDPEYLKNEKGIEGYVLKTNEGDWFKVKTNWYVLNARAIDANFNVRSFFIEYAHGRADDLEGSLKRELVTGREPIQEATILKLKELAANFIQDAIDFTEEVHKVIETLPLIERGPYVRKYPIYKYLKPLVLKQRDLGIIGLTAKAMKPLPHTSVYDKDLDLDSIPTFRDLWVKE